MPSIDQGRALRRVPTIDAISPLQLFPSGPSRRARRQQSDASGASLASGNDLGLPEHDAAQVRGQRRRRGHARRRLVHRCRADGARRRRPPRAVVDPARKNALPRDEPAARRAAEHGHRVPGGAGHLRGVQAEAARRPVRRQADEPTSTSALRKNIYDIDSPDSNWTLAKGFAEWTCNRGGGPLAARRRGRDDGAMEKYVQDMAKMSTDDRGGGGGEGGGGGGGLRQAHADVKAAKATSEYAAVTRRSVAVRSSTWARRRAPRRRGLVHRESRACTVDGRAAPAAAPAHAASHEGTAAAVRQRAPRSIESRQAPGGRRRSPSDANNGLLTSIAVRRPRWLLPQLPRRFNQISRIPEARECPRPRDAHAHRRVTADTPGHSSPSRS